MSDLISRQKAIKRIEELPNSPNGYSSTYDKASIIMAIEDVEPVEFVHAHWRWMLNHDVICSKCQYVLPSGSPVSDFRFCPHCGAKMNKVVE